MSCRISLLVAAAAVFAGAFAAHAAMPVTGTAAIGLSSDMMLAQAPPAATPPSAATAEGGAAPAKKKKSGKSARQKEVDRSVESGTVPKRYRSSVPKEYHHMIPFAK